MKKKRKNLDDLTKAEVASKKAKIEKENVNQMRDINGEAEEEEYNTNLIYNFFNFFIGGPNKANIKNKQKGKPGGTPPPY